jgi:hypothetical protein
MKFTKVTPIARKPFRNLACAAVCFASLAGSAIALPSALELGAVLPGSPADPTDETARLTTLVDGYNSGLSGILSNSFTGDSDHLYVLAPAAGMPAEPLPSVGTDNGQVGNGNGPQTGLTVNLGAGGGYDYVLVKWGDIDEFYYIGGMTGAIVINNNVDGNGESHYDLFSAPAGSNNSVPDNGTTVALLGLAMTGLFVTTHVFRRNA